MKLLEDRILKEGVVLPGNVLKVGSFLNHAIDISLADEMAKEFYRLFGDRKVTKILTIESSGIAIGSLTALQFGCPLVFVKKSNSSNVSGECYRSVARSYTHSNVYTAVVPKQYLSSDDFVLIVDDFLATGEASEAMVDIVRQSGATLVGIGILVEKTFQTGGKKLRSQGIHVESLASVESMENGKIVFTKQ